MKKLLRIIALSWICTIFFIPLYPAIAQGDIQSSSKIPDLQLQIPIDKITGSGNAQLQPSNTTPDPSARLPVEKLSKITSEEIRKGSGLGTYITTIYRWIVTAIAMLAVLSIMFGGIWWLTAAGSTKRISFAKKLIRDSFWGLAIVLGSYILLSTLSKELVDFRLIAPGSTTKVQKIK